MRTTIVLDATGLMYRSFHGVPPMRTTEGEYTHAVYGFTGTLFDAIEQASDGGTNSIVAVFDDRGPTFRDELWPSYKEDRERPEMLDSQFKRAEQICDVLGVPWLAWPGVEADDVIATIAEIRKHDKNDLVQIVTVDKDMLQLLDTNVRIYDPYKQIVKSDAACVEKFGVLPEHVTDVQALMGDTSDGYPGVKGIGMKKAAALIKDYGGIEEVIRAANYLNPKGAVWDAIRATPPDDIRTFKKLATLKRDVDLGLVAYLMGQFSWPDFEAAEKLFEELEFNRHLKRLQKYKDVK